MKKLLFILFVSACFAEEIDVFKLAENGTPEQFQSALEHGAKFNVKRDIHDYTKEYIIDWLYDSNETPLHRAAAYNHNPESIKFLIAQGIDVNTVASFSNIATDTPLICALWHKNVIAVKELLKAGADLNTRDSGGFSFTGTPLHIVAFDYNDKNDIPIAKELITALVEAGANVNNHKEIPPERLIEYELGEDKTIFLHQNQLIDGEAYFYIKIFSHATNGNFLMTLTPLMWAVFYDNPDMINIFLDFNADVNIRSVENKTAVDYANELPENSKLKNSPVFKKLKSRQISHEIFRETN